MFRGNHSTRVDDKGRLKLPAEFKRQVDEQGVGQFYITSKDGKRAEIYPMPEWEKIEQKLSVIPNFNVSKRKFMDAVSFYGQVVEIDSQGRLLLPQELREAAKVTGDVVVFGMQTYLEVVNREGFLRDMAVNPLTLEDQAELAALGL